jgi:hypothetical protein
MNLTWSIRADCREEVLAFQIMRYVVEFLAIAGEEDCSRAWLIADAYHVALDKVGVVFSARKGLVMPPDAVGDVSEGVLVVSCHILLAIIPHFVSIVSLTR